MRQVQNFIREQKMIMPGDFVIAGVSGGADSVCLFFELLAYQKEIPFSMEVVHIEHGIRGALQMRTMWKTSAKNMVYRFTWFPVILKRWHRKAA